MAELTSQERLQPCLLDRLTDEKPGSSRESRNEQIISPQQYRQSVLRDLGWLLNTSNRESTGEYDDFPEVQSSVLNYGVRDFSGLNAYTMALSDLQKSVGRAVRRFEPRIDEKGLRCFTETDEDGYDLVEWQTATIGIEGTLWNKPMPESLYVKTEVDLETGECTLSPVHG